MIHGISRVHEVVLRCKVLIKRRHNIIQSTKWYKELIQKVSMIEFKLIQ